MRIQFEVFSLPQTKGSVKSFIPKGARWPVVTNDNVKNKAWAALVALKAQSVKPPALWRGPVRLALVFWLPMPRTIPAERKGWPTTRPDLDKLTRSVKDALTGIIWRDDSQVCVSEQQKRYSATPGVGVTLEEL